MTPRLQAVVGATVYVSTLIALVILLIVGRPVDSIMLMAGPAVAALLVNARVSATAAETATTLAKIDRQTNGILDQRIVDGVRTALADTAYPGRHEGT